MLRIKGIIKFDGYEGSVRNPEKILPTNLIINNIGRIVFENLLGGIKIFIAGK